MQPLIPRIRLPLEPRLIAIGGGGGGVGRSTIARELATQLARRGRRVLLVDAIMQGGTQHYGLKTPPEPVALHLDIESEDFDLEAAILEAERDKPALLSLPFARRGAAFPPRLRAMQLVEQLREQSWEDILFDLDGRPDAFNASVLALSDVPLLVTSTEAPSLAMTVETLRQMIVYAMLLQPEADSLERRLLDALEALPTQFGLQELHEAFQHPDLQTLLHHVLESAAPWLLLNQTRDAGERDLAQPIALGFGAMVGIRPRVLGAIGWDEQRWQYLRNGFLQQSLNAPGDSIASVVQRLLFLRDTADQQPRIPPAHLRLPTELIGTTEDLPPNDIRLAWRRLWDGLRRETNFTQFVLPTEAREGLLLQLEEANQRLQGWLTRDQVPRSKNTETPVVHSPVARSLQEARAVKGISVRDLSLRSRIGLRYLEAIEGFEIAALPREVYLRGYLREIARALDLDPDQLVENYLEELHAERVRRLGDA